MIATVHGEEVYFWDALTGRSLGKLDQPSAVVPRVRFAADGSGLLITHESGVARLDIDKFLGGKPEWEQLLHLEAEPTCLAVAPAKNAGSFAVGIAGKVVIWSPPERKQEVALTSQRGTSRLSCL